ncbi:MAG: hypothetical protein ACLTS6_13150 [Anaerobutyricum sp.]
MLILLILLLPFTKLIVWTKLWFYYSNRCTARDTQQFHLLPEVVHESSAKSRSGVVEGGSFYAGASNMQIIMKSSLYSRSQEHLCSPEQQSRSEQFFGYSAMAAVISQAAWWTRYDHRHPLPDMCRYRDPSIMSRYGCTACCACTDFPSIGMFPRSQTC